MRELATSELEKIREEIGDDEWFEKEGRPDLSRSLFERVALSDEFVEFLTLPAYDELLKLEQLERRLQPGRLVQLGDLFAEESYLFDEIGQACHLAVRPRFECEGVGEGDERMVQSGGRVGTGEPFDPVLGGSGDHDAIRDGVGCELERTLDVARANAALTGATSSGSMPCRSSSAGGIEGM